LQGERNPERIAKLTDGQELGDYVEPLDENVAFDVLANQLIIEVEIVLSD